eukprot:CAMPEP_0204081968 /NCGR_PEP_ID=MMETSP0360-20130528/176344_1 /ASSEMBLY_ACC=CAM_ASM_000342 /TAXON_ID=268821 /ORGANISM="Scrippsiella Hangoei, Strain SHTV-5" /LENGTH=190 /DNA_ID=CAMNT_0051030837 /DNA_START=40 /DNA_END=612 /DNA_ORIENTATION=+
MPAKLRDPNSELLLMEVAAIASMSFSSTICRLANADAMPESSSGLKAEIFLRASADRAANSCSFAKATEAKAHEVLAKCCAENSAIRFKDWAAIDSSSGPWQHRNLAKDHAVLANHCALKSEILARAAAESAARSGGSFKLNVAHDHSVLARPWMLNSPIMHRAASEIASRKGSSRIASVAYDHARLPSS